MRLRMFVRAAVVALGFAVGLAAVPASAVPYSFVQKYEGNDCSGVFGTGFASCKLPEEHGGSPIIAKFDVETGWSVNTTVFPGLSSSMFDVDNFGTTGLWSYLGTTGVAITHFVLKSSNSFALFKMDTPGTSFTDIAWSTLLGGLTNDKGKAQALSHISFYDTAMPQVPVPAAGLLLLTGLGALGALRMRRRKTA